MNALSGRCPSCGYDLTGSPGPRCPECGVEPGRWPAMRLEAARELLVQTLRGLCFWALLLLPLFGALFVMSMSHGPAVPAGHLVLAAAGAAWCAVLVVLISLRPSRTRVQVLRDWFAALCLAPALVLLGLVVAAEM